MNKNLKMRKEAGSVLNQITQSVLQATPKTHTLFGGHLTRAFYFSYLYELTSNKEHALIAQNDFEKTVLDFNQNRATFSGPYLCNGTAGLLYLSVLFTKKGLVKLSYKKDLKPLVEHLTEVANLGIENDNNDFIHGAFGVLYAVSEYASITKDYKSLRVLLNKIETKYLKLHNPWIPCGKDQESTSAEINLSLSHGQCGLLLVLLHAYKTLGCKQETLKLLQRNVDYVVGLKSDVPIENTFSYFPSIIDIKDKTNKTSNRLAWCYGDLGNTLLLHTAGDFFKSINYSTIAEDIGIKTTQRKDYKSTFVTDSYLCHGAAGVAHIYKALYKNTGLYKYQNAYLYWISKTIKITKKELLELISEDSIKTLNLAEGLSGVGLTLMSYLSPKHLDWGKVMLID